MSNSDTRLYAAISAAVFAAFGLASVGLILLTTA